ncbi:hypothetical protein [Streptomyces prunicolor]|uniref:hypothetical protein n=1 Tax=Streptomyces prunicolor TaxID=67348 RepID=UPI0003A5CDBC|nr:hypothetical protein [Streptomyces prunicolor]
MGTGRLPTLRIMRIIGQPDDAAVDIARYAGLVTPTGAGGVVERLTGMRRTEGAR